jgi:hypothetical protein
MVSVWNAKIAVVTFIYPAVKKYIGDLIFYLNSQTYRDFVLIVFNDGVVDANSWFYQLKNTYQIENVEKDTPMGIRFQAFEKLKCMNLEYLIFQDSDDGLSPNRIEVLSKLLQKYPMVVNDIDLIDDSGSLKYPNYWKKRFDLKPTFFSSDLALYNFAGLGNTAIKSCLLEQLPQKPKIDLIAVDWYIFYCLMRASNAIGYCTSECTTLYRQHDQNIIGLKTNSKQEFVSKVREQHFTALLQAGIFDDSKIEDNKIDSIESSFNPFWWEIV